MVGILHGPSNHDHDSDDEMIQSDAFREAVKERVREDCSRPIKRAYDATSSAAARGGYLRLNRQSVPEFHHVRSSASRAKQSEVPLIPRRINDVHVTGVYAETWNGDSYLLHADNAWGILMFATSENLTVLQQCSDIHIDGTFRSVPKPYYQFVTIHGNFHGRVIPLVGVLMNGKTIGQYRQVFQTLKTNVRQTTGHRLKPKRIVCDFEIALISSVETEIPGARICGCLFHFRQSLFRKLKELGLGQAYRQDQNFKAAVAKFMSMGFLPVQLVRHNFVMFSTSRAFIRLCMQYPSLNLFVRYIDNTYIVGRFPPPIWNVYMRTRRNRSNNYVEGYVKKHNYKLTYTSSLCLD